MKVWTLLGVLLLLPAAKSFGQDTKADFAVFLAGTSRWSDLSDVVLVPTLSDLYGDFGRWGYNFDVGYYRRLLRFGQRDFRIGGEFGLFFRPSSEKTELVSVFPGADPVPVSLNARGMYLTAGIRHVFGNGRRPRLFAGGGGGLYGVDIAELFERGGLNTFELTTYFEEYKAGGYFSGGLIVPLPWRLLNDVDLLVESKVHFVSFGTSPFFSGSLGGPVYIYQVGFSP